MLVSVQYWNSWFRTERQAQHTNWSTCDMRQVSLWEQLRPGCKSLSLVVAGISACPYQHSEELSRLSPLYLQVIGEGATDRDSHRTRFPRLETSTWTLNTRIGTRLLLLFRATLTFRKPLYLDRYDLKPKASKIPSRLRQLNWFTHTDSYYF